MWLLSYGTPVPVTFAGKLFTIIYILVGLGVFVAAASAVAEALIRREANLRKRQDDAEE